MGIRVCMRTPLMLLKKRGEGVLLLFSGYYYSEISENIYLSIICSLRIARTIFSFVWNWATADLFLYWISRTSSTGCCFHGISSGKGSGFAITCLTDQSSELYSSVFLARLCIFFVTSIPYMRTAQPLMWSFIQFFGIGYFVPLWSRSVANGLPEFLLKKRTIVSSFFHTFAFSKNLFIVLFF